jgi:ubiquinone/menaquinone biosynthesis C-methylase UbiE
MLKLIYQDWDNALHPNFIKDPEVVLDCGYGSGNWAYDLAEYDSNCTVS